MTPEEIRNLKPNKEYVHDTDTDRILLYEGLIEGFHVFSDDSLKIQSPDHALADFSDRFTPSDPPPEPEEEEEESEPENTEENN